MAKSKGAKKSRGANGGGKKQKKSPVQKNGKAKPQEVVVEITYDSDSFENHVIDLRGDEEYQSARQEHSDAGSSDFEERSSLKEEAQSQSEGSFGNGVSLNADEGATDSEMAATHSEELIEGTVSNGAVSTLVSDMGDGADGDEGTSLAVVDPLHFIHGQLVWAKFARFPWWPAQVTDERTVPVGTGGDHRSSKDVLVRFFGTYDYGWVDPKVGLSDFNVKLQERSKIRKKALQKGIEEALDFRRTGKLPDSFVVDAVEEEEPKTPPKKSNGNGVQENGNGKQYTPEDGGSEQRPARKRKPKVLYEEEERVQRKPERRLRRLRIMRQLGLAAPAGSPFTLDTRLSV